MNREAMATGIGHYLRSATAPRLSRDANVGFERQDRPRPRCDLGDLATIGEGCEEQLWDLTADAKDR
jgi:hypothetical protein